MGGTTAGTYYDQVNVSGTTFAGALDVTLFNGFGPSVPQEFTVLTAQGSISGSFDTTNLPAVDGHAALQVQTERGTAGKSLNLLAIIDSADLATTGGSITVNSVSPAAASGTTGQSISVGYTIQNLSPSACERQLTDFCRTPSGRRNIR